MGLFSRQPKINRRRKDRGEELKSGVTSLGRKVWRVLPTALGVALFVALPVGVFMGWEQVSQLDVFDVKEVDIVGAKHTNKDALLSAMGVAGYEGGEVNIFEIDPHKAQTSLLALPWIRAAEVDRRLPSRVRIVVEERDFGGVVYGRGLFMADKNGVPFKVMEDEVDVDQPVVTGIDKAPSDMDETDFLRVREAFRIMDLYQEAGLDKFDRLSEVQVHPLTGYALVTERKRIRILLGEGRMEERLKRLKDVYDTLEARDLQASLVRLDMERSLGRVAITPRRTF